MRYGCGHSIRTIKMQLFTPNLQFVLFVALLVLGVIYLFVSIFNIQFDSPRKKGRLKKKSKNSQEDPRLLQFSSGVKFLIFAGVLYFADKDISRFISLLRNLN